MTEMNHLNTKAKILEGTRAYLIKNGSQNFSARSVAKEAGVNHGLIHHYFGSRENLILDFIDYIDQQTENALKELMEAAGGKPQLAFFINKVVLNKQVSTLIAELLSMAREYNSVKEKLNKLIHKRIELLGNLIESDDRRDAVLLAAVVQGLIVLNRINPDLETEPLLKRWIEKIEEGK